MANTTLTLQSSNEELKAYFEAVCKIVDSNSDEFPINLDEVWPLCYGRKSDAVEALAKDFLQDVDYKVIRQNPQNPLGGRPINGMLTPRRWQKRSINLRVIGCVLNRLKRTSTPFQVICRFPYHKS